MRVKRSLYVTLVALLAAALLVVVFAPFLVASGLRLWAERAARREGLQLEIGGIEAPLLRSVIVRDVHLRTDAAAPFQLDCVASRLDVALNLAAIFTHNRRPLRVLNIDGLTLNIRRNNLSASSSRAAPWALLKNLQADAFQFSNIQLHVEDGPTTVDFRDASLNGSELEAGLLTARELVIVAPWFQKTIPQIRGATSWQDSRLVLGAISLMPGLDLDTVTIDLAQIGDSRVGMEVSLDVFAGKLRARISSDDRSGRRTWDIVGNGSGISLARMSDALEWSNRASGSLHATKFTFRGELSDLRNATATVWAEVSGLTWRDRTADTVMIGASLYNREIQVEQLYLKQRDNQLTLSGEVAWPERWSLTEIPEFRADLSASINNLGELARLFGWTPSEFTGNLSAQGSVDARAGKFGGQLSASGNSLVLFRSPVESLDLKLALVESRLEVTQFELHQKDDFVRGEGSVALAGDHAYTLSAQCSIGDLANYGFIPPGILPFSLAGSAAVEWKARGTNDNDSGSVRVHGRGLRDNDGALAPFDAEVEADYSPDNIFFRQLHLWNARADLSAFVTVAKDYFHLQDLRVSLDNKARALGNVYLPLSVMKIRNGAAWLTALSADPFFDVDLALDSLDLGEFAAAVETKPNLSGNASGKLQLSGTPASLQGETEFHLHDFALDASPVLTTDLEARLSLGVANFKANAVLRSSEPVKIEGAVPVQLAKRDAGYSLRTDGPFSATVDFPALFLANLPRYLCPGFFTRGILVGNLILSDSLKLPAIKGNVSLIDGKLLHGEAVSSALTFKGQTAAVDYARISEPNAELAFRGEIDFGRWPRVEVGLTPNLSLDAAIPDAADCVGSFDLIASSVALPVSVGVERIALRGELFTADWTIDLVQRPAPDVDAITRSFPLCRSGKPLSIARAPAWFP
jgi:hypothetical protein